MAPRADGTLFVSIPGAVGAVLALLDPDGRPRPGWPIVIEHSTWCRDLLAASDGSVRAVCDAQDLPKAENEAYAERTFAFDADGRLMSVQLGEICCEEGADGAEEITVLVEEVGEWSDDGPPEVSRMTVRDPNGVRAGWPVTFAGISSDAAFLPDGRIIVTVASNVRSTSRVLAFEPGGCAVAAESAELPIQTAETGVDCVRYYPQAPIVAGDGTIFVDSDLDPAIFALDASLAVKPGWPFTPATDLQWANPWAEDGLDCSEGPRPVVGPDSVLYLRLLARDETDGGSIVAVGPDGRIRPGWPVELQRPGAEFWSVVVGPDGTAYALAIEPEAGDSSSATIVAIAPDSTVRFTTTLIDPAAALAPGCPPEPSIADLARLGGAKALACYGSGDLKIRAFRLRNCGDVTSDRNTTPDWLAGLIGGETFMDRAADWDDDAALKIHGRAHPSLLNAGTPYFGCDAGGWFDVTGHYDDPASSECRTIYFYSDAQPEDPAVAIAECRRTFVYTDLVPAPGP